MNTPELAKAVEKTIYDYLVDLCFFPLPPCRAEIARVQLYIYVESRLRSHGIITTGFFNGIISDMKRAGVIGTARGGEAVFLSEYSWKLEYDKRNQDSEIDALRREIAASDSLDAANSGKAGA